MSEHKRFFGRLLAAIGSIFTGLFNEMKKVYNDLPQEAKDALLHGTGIIDILNTEIGKTPAELRALILSKYPDLDETKLEEGLFRLIHVFKLLPDSNNIDDVITAIQSHLKSLEGKEWATFSHAASSLLAALFSGPETKVASIVSLIEYVYQHFFKKQ